MLSVAPGEIALRLTQDALADYREGSIEGLRKLSVDRSKTVQRLTDTVLLCSPPSDFFPYKGTGYWRFRPGFSNLRSFFTMRFVLWRTCDGDQCQQAIARAIGLTLFVVPSLLGDPKTT